MSIKKLSKKKLADLVIELMAENDEVIDENAEMIEEVNYYKEKHEGLLKEINCHKKQHTGLLEKIDYYEEQHQYFLEESKIKTNILIICQDSLEEQAEEIKKSGELIEELRSVIVNQAKQINYLSKTEKD